MKRQDVAVIGAGPAGIMAAITAAENGKRVVLVERNSQVGRKLLSTGNGRCNLTNTRQSVERYHGATPAFIEAVLSQFDQNATIDFFAGLGLVLKEEDNGRVFPRTNQASSVVEVLKRRLAQCGVELALDAQVQAIEKAAGWRVGLVGDGQIEADELVIATGGRAAHHLGSTGDGLFWARRLGHSLTPIYAALVPVETEEAWPKELAGTKVEAATSATSEDATISEAGGDLLFTSYGVSGPSIMAQAGSIAAALKTASVQLHIDLFPDMPEEMLDQTVLRVLGSCGESSLASCLVGLLPSSIIPVALRLAGLENARANAISPRQRLAFARTLKDLTCTVSKLRPFKEAQVTVGGVNCEEIDACSLRSKLVEGLYFAGEVLDVDAESGGFNLQWAWSSGRVAGSLRK